MPYCAVDENVFVGYKSLPTTLNLGVVFTLYCFLKFLMPTLISSDVSSVYEPVANDTSFQPILTFG